MDAPIKTETAKAGATILASIEDPVLMGQVAGLLGVAIPGLSPLIGFAVGNGVPALVKFLDTHLGPTVSNEDARAWAAQTKKSSGKIDVDAALEPGGSPQ